MGARVYIPSLGRFLQTDPIPGGNANAYVYVLDPIMGSDYSGLFCQLQCSNFDSAQYLQDNHRSAPAVLAVAKRVAAVTVAHTKTANTDARRYNARPAKKVANSVDMSKIKMSPVARTSAPIPARSSGPASSYTPRASIFDTAKEYGGAAVSGCVGSASIVLAVGGTATIVTGGAAALPSAGAAVWSCASGAVGGIFVHWLDPPYDLSPMEDVYDGLSGARGL